MAEIKISAEDKKEVIKAKAFGYTVEQIMTVTGYSKDDIADILKDADEDIAAVKERYENG